MTANLQIFKPGLGDPETPSAQGVSGQISKSPTDFAGDCENGHSQPLTNKGFADKSPNLQISTPTGEPPLGDRPFHRAGDTVGDGHVLVLGIDPGKRGALALLDKTTGALEIEDVPILTIRGKTVVDHYGLARIVDAWAPRNPLVAIELVGSRPGEGHAGAFDFGRTCGLILGVCAANFLRVEYVTPAKWKAAMGVKGDKDESRQRAATLFPRQSGLFARVRDDGRAEAALIAAWGAHALEAAHDR